MTENNEPSANCLPDVAVVCGDNGLDVGAEPTQYTLGDQPVDLFVSTFLTVRLGDTHDYHLMRVFVDGVEPGIYFVDRLIEQVSIVPPVQLSVDVEELLIGKDPNEAGSHWALQEIQEHLALLQTTEMYGFY